MTAKAIRDSQICQLSRDDFHGLGSRIRGSVAMSCRFWPLKFMPSQGLVNASGRPRVNAEEHAAIKMVEMRLIGIIA